MDNKKALFITQCDIYDTYGNGGVQGARKNYELIEKYFGKQNTLLATFPRSVDVKPPDNAIVFRRVQSSLGKVIAACFGCKIYYPWNEKEIINFIKEKDIDFLFLDYSHLGRLARIKGKHKTVIFYGNIEADYAWNKVKNEGIHYLLSYFASKYNDKHGLKADGVLCINQRDSNRLNELYGKQADFILNVSFDDQFKEQKTITEYKREILFLGSLFPPNQHSIEWFIKEVMPELDNITLNIVGKGFENKREKYEKYPNVNVIGFVEDISEYYYRHAVVVQPIIYGAGMKVKTAEAMMYGRTIVASDEALEGYEVDGVEGIYRCNTAREYINKLNDLFSDLNFPKYQPAVRDLFHTKYSTTVLQERFFLFLDELLTKEE